MFFCLPCASPCVVTLPCHLSTLWCCPIAATVGILWRDGLDDTDGEGMMDSVSRNEAKRIVQLSLVE